MACGSLFNPVGISLNYLVKLYKKMFAVKQALKKIIRIVPYAYGLLIWFYPLPGKARNKVRNIKYRRVVKKLLDENELRRKISQLDKIVESSDKKTYYIIRRDCDTIGLFTYVAVFLGHIAYAVGKGYVPVIDMKNYPSIYLEDDDIGKKNCWEFYFKQPYNCDLDNIYKNEKYILSPTRIQPMSPFIKSIFCGNESMFWKILSKKYIVLSDTAEKYIKDEHTSLIRNNMKVLGVLFRGTDYVKMKPYGHPIQPNINEFIIKVTELNNEWGGFDYIYIASEERDAVEKLEKMFPNKVIINKRVYYDGLGVDYCNQGLSEVSFNRERDKYLKGLEYLSSVVILSKCNSFIGGLCAGTYAVNYMNPAEFEHKYFFYKGVY